MSDHIPASENEPGPEIKDDTLAKFYEVTLASIFPRVTTPLPDLGLRIDADGELTRRLKERHWRQLRRKHLYYVVRKRMRHTHVGARQSSRSRFWLRALNICAALFLVCISLATAGGVFAYHYYDQTQTAYERQILTIRDLLPLDNLKIYDSTGLLVGQLSDQGFQTTVAFKDIASPLVQATVATEDKYFWSNQGVDPLRILRSALDDLEQGRFVEGGSTITQQLIKNLIVGDQTTLIRKLNEIILAPQLNNHYSKQDILTMYLNSISYGHQAYGIDAASTLYFGLLDQPSRPASLQLDLAQSAFLAGLPNAPSLYDPLSTRPELRQAAFQRFTTVLNLMLAQGAITKAQKAAAISEAQAPHFFKRPSNLLNRAPHFFDFVIQQMQQMFHLTRAQLSRSGLLVHTTVKVSLQDKILKIARTHIAALKANHVSNAAEVLIDFHTGAILSLLGSLDYNNAAINGQFDVATQGYRQPGSSFKPYVYVTAFENGISPAQAIEDSPLSIATPGAPDPTFSPQNYDRLYHGHMTLRCALQNSLNVPAVKVLQHVGINNALQTAQDMGITSYRGTPGYSMVLGGLSIHLLDHTSAMGTFANGGVHVPYYAIQKIISSRTGSTIYEHQTNPGTSVISPQMAYLMTNVLSDNTDRIPEFFDCNVLQLYSNSQQSCWQGQRGTVRPAAVKTGTTETFRDNWTVGYTTDFVMGVWAGNDDNSPMLNVSGVQGAAPIWHDAMLQAEKGLPIRDFQNPGGLEWGTATYPDGIQTNDWFLPGTEPVFTPPPTATPTDPGDLPFPLPTPPTSTPPAPLPTPYCPASYSFAFPPPHANQDSTSWW